MSRCPVLVALVVIATGSCSAPSGAPPAASFLVASGDSTFWITTRPSGSEVRRAPLLLAHVNGRFSEVYAVDDDRSFFDAVFVGQHLYRRDLLSGDSSAILVDTLVEALAGEYARKHPDDAPLSPDEPENPNPAVLVATDTEILDVFGPYLTFEQHTDAEGAGLDAAHTTRRGVIDLRSGRPVHLSALLGEPGARELRTRGHSLLVAARDSIRKLSDTRARRAQGALAGFDFDSSSFVLTISGGAPAIAFFVPGRGTRAGGLALPLEPIPIARGSWWREVEATLPHSVAGGDDVWGLGHVEVAARYDSSGAWADLFLRASQTTQREWHVARVPTPINRLHAIAPDDSAIFRALARAFDDAALYSGVAKSARWSLLPPRPLGRRLHS